MTVAILPTVLLSADESRETEKEAVNSFFIGGPGFMEGINEVLGSRTGIVFSVTVISRVITNPYGCLAHLFFRCHREVIDLPGKLTEPTELLIIKFFKDE